MKILFMGTPDFAEVILRAITLCKEHEVVAAVTQPDRPKGRKKALSESPVKIYARQCGIPVLQPEKIKNADEIAKLREYDADIYVVAAFGQILSKEILEIPRYGCINVHASLLPKYRGSSPIQRAIADGEEVTGVTVQQMNEGVDTGDIIDFVRVAISPDETGGSLFDKLAEEGAKLIVKTLSDIEAGRAKRTPQDDTKATYAGMLKKEMGRIDWQTDASSIERMIRAYTPWPGGFTYLSQKVLKITEAEALTGNADRPCGTVTEVSKDHFLVACKSGMLRVTKVQAEGKKEMTVHDFLLGNSLSVGTILGG
ncbi:MAG: methionyl-tRNA formyltransferase [Lachnospiraceae bacterium]|nr:methionyl-tRNA formyltransferase [Lachnospiraceae bacterium]